MIANNGRNLIAQDLDGATKFFKMKNIKMSVLSIALVSFLILTPAKAEAKGFGTETNTTTHYMGAGQCLTTTTLYIFWIKVQETVEYNIVNC